MNPLVLTCLTSVAFFMPNASPWGGPTTRTMAVLQLGLEDLFIPMLPAYGIGAVWVLFVAYILGTKERKRLGYVKTADNRVSDPVGMSVLLENQDPALLRPNLIWVNFALFGIAMVALVKSWLPASVLFIIAFALVIVINYRDFGVMQGRIMAHAGNALWATTMIFAAGIFTGIFKDTKMLDSLAKALVALIPDALGPHMGVVASVFGSLLPVMLGPDALYFGVVPVISQAAAVFGFTPVEIGRAFLVGQWTYAVSPMIGATLLLCSLAKVEFIEHQKFAFIWGFSTCMVIMLASVLMGLFRL
jgi:CitMHS family citrate-Mg2+:H+ or citrate-Ca2+:H+ symporter